MTGAVKTARILTATALDWRNGHEFALQALSILKQRGVKFSYCLAGDGPFLEAVGFARHEFNLQDEVRLVLQPGPQEVEKLFRDADIFLLAAVAPGGAHLLARAARQGLPIIMSDLLELKTFAPFVRIVPRRNVHALVVALEDVIKSIYKDVQ